MVDLQELFVNIDKLGEEYTEEQYYEDLMTFAKNLQLRNNSKQDGWISTMVKRRYKEYSDEQIDQFLASPREHERELREIARYLENTSQIFQQAISYLPNINKICPIIIPTRPDQLKTIKVQYEQACNYMSLLNLPHNLLQVHRVCFREDVFYGLEYESKDAYYIKMLNPDYCRISGVEYGCYVFQMDMAYFDNKANNDVDIELLDEYEQYIPGFFTKAYTEYKKDHKKKWVELPGKNTICIKFKEELDYCYPPFASIYQDIKDIDDYKGFSKVAEEQANYKIIGFKIPRLDPRTERTDNFAIKLSTAKLFFELARNSINESIGMFYSPMEFESMNFNNGTTNSRNKIEEATEQFYDDLGFSRLLFNSDTATTLQYSIKLDESKLFSLNRQLETWVTRKFIYNFKGNFRCQFIDITELSKSEVTEQYRTAATYGIPSVIHYCAALGINQVDMMALNYLQNDVLEISTKFIPLSSSNTQSGMAGNDEKQVNRNNTTKSGKPLSESTIKNRENGVDEETKASKVN